MAVLRRAAAAAAGGEGPLWRDATDEDYASAELVLGASGPRERRVGRPSTYAPGGGGGSGGGAARARPSNNNGNNNRRRLVSLLQGGVGGPRGRMPRFGKSAYVQALPQLTGGFSQHASWELPGSRVWEGREWGGVLKARQEAERAAELMRIKKEEEEEAAALAEAERKAKEEKERDQAQGTKDGALVAVKKEEGEEEEVAVKLESEKEGVVKDDPMLLDPPAEPEGGTGVQIVVKTEPEPESTNREDSSAPNPPLGSLAQAVKKEKVAKTVPWRERLRQARAMETTRLTFGKSGVHGWGMFARCDIPQDTAIYEVSQRLARGATNTAFRLAPHDLTYCYCPRN